MEEENMQTADNAYQTSGEAAELIKEILADVEKTESASERNSVPAPRSISVDDLHLVCWEYVWS